MAANSKGRAIAGVFGKRIASQIWVRNPAPLPATSASCFRRVANFTSSYDKNVEDQVRPAVVPDYVIASEADKYWGPNPKTGVFGPADPRSATTGGGRARSTAAEAEAGARAGAGPGPGPGDGSSSSVLDQTAWFRPLEDVEKPASH